MKNLLESKDTIVYVDGKKYRLLDIDESGEHPVFHVSSFESEEDDNEEYTPRLPETDVKYLIWELISACPGTYCMIYGGLQFLLSEVCHTLQIEYGEAVNMLGDENIIYGVLINGEGNKDEDYASITESQLAYLCTKSPLATAKKLGKFLIDNSAEIKAEIVYEN